ncbi:MAG TPA: tRNA lysidine(34) synthetase TilS [Flavisolibacter sp.]|nr:tRNA lysidine(34) synthetase TilS [Flavisolibacter sp.]
MIEKFTSFLSGYEPLGEHHFLVAISGGIDSVVLSHLCKLAGLRFTLAHVNFQLRGEESEGDEAFVKELAEHLQVPLLVNRFDTAAIAQQEKISIQEAARDLRYGWFHELHEEEGYDYVLLAHHANDSIETLVMNFFRGSGLGGMTGIPPERDGYILRPLLQTTRKEIEAYAQQRGLAWREDSSNASTKYTRNLFRHELLPLLQKVYPQVEQNLMGTMDRMLRTNRIYKEAVTDLKKKLLEYQDNEVRIPVKKLQAYLDTSLIYEIIKDYGFGEGQVQEVEKLLQSETGKYIANESHQIIRHGVWLIIAPVQEVHRIIAFDEEPSTVSFPGGTLQWQRLTKESWQLDPHPQIAQLDARLVEFPLILRQWKAADYFYPLGLRKKKKLSRFFIDQKLSRNKKEQVWVLESNKKILWVVGMRIDDRFKVTEATNEVLSFRMTSL